MKSLSILSVFITIISFTSVEAQVYNISDYGAIADGKTINTQAIQKAIDECSKTRGQVLIPKGVFLSGTLYLKSHVHIYLSDGSVLKGSPSFKDYPDNHVTYKNFFTHYPDGRQYHNKAFLFAEDVTDISLSGKGTIDGHGDSFEFNLGNDNTEESRSRPCMLLIINSRKIRLNDLFLTNSAYWMQNYLGCDDLKIRGIRVYNQTNYNQDGMDIDASNVLVENCILDVDDDGICFKSHDRNRICKNILVRNCTISSNCSAIKFGTTSIGGLKDVKVTNCTIKKASADHIRHWQQALKFIDQPVTVLAGIALEAVDGGIVENVHFNKITMQDVQTPIFIVLGNRGRPQIGENKPSPVGKVSNVVLEHISAISHSKMASSITAFPGYYVENIQLKHVYLNDMGKGTSEDANLVLPENPGTYPENRMYGQIFPCSGLFVRHVKRIILSDVKFALRNEDFRPSIILDDVLDSEISGLDVAPPSGKKAAISLVRCRNIMIRKPKIKPYLEPFIKLEGTKQEDVILKN